MKDLEVIWKPVVGFEDKYEISSEGNIRSLCSNKDPYFIRKLSLNNKTEYLQCTLKVSGKGTSGKIHRMVAQAFIPNPLNLPCVNHINGIKTDNRVENLEWVTYKENTHHAMDLGIMNTRRGEQSSKKFTELDILNIRILYDSGEFSFSKIAKIYHVSAPTIRCICKRLSWRHLP